IRQRGSAASRAATIFRLARTQTGIQYGHRSGYGYRDAAAGERNLQNTETGVASACLRMIATHGRSDSLQWAKRASSGSRRPAFSLLVSVRWGPLLLTKLFVPASDLCA